MLPKNQKLKLDKEFNEIFKTGRSVYGRFLGVKLVKNKFNYSRFGVILGTKIEKSAIKRHFLKRLIYRVVEENKKRLSFPCDCVIIALPTIKKVAFSDLNKDFEDIFNKIFIIK